MILQSLRAYWLALAYQEKGEIEPILLERMFKKAVYALEKCALYLCDQAGIDYPTNLYREAFLLKPSPLSKEICPVGEGKNINADSPKIQNNGLITDELFELVGGDEFDDSGFS